MDFDLDIEDFKTNLYSFYDDLIDALRVVFVDIIDNAKAGKIDIHYDYDKACTLGLFAGRPIVQILKNLGYTPSSRSTESSGYEFRVGWSSPMPVDFIKLDPYIINKFGLVPAYHAVQLVPRTFPEVLKQIKINIENTIKIGLSTLQFNSHHVPGLMFHMDSILHYLVDKKFNVDYDSPILTIKLFH